MAFVNLSFAEEEKKYIQDVFSYPTPKGSFSTEIEFRITDLHHFKDQKYFINFWNSTLSRIKNEKKYIDIIQIEDLVEYRGNIRKITSSKLNQDGKTESIIYQQKIKNDQHGESMSRIFKLLTSFESKKTEYNAYFKQFKLAKAFEVNVKESDFLKATTGKKVIFKRKRTSFLFQNFTIDFTIRTDQHDEEQYELEGEFKETFIKNIKAIGDNVKSQSWIREFLSELKVAIHTILPDFHTIYLLTDKKSFPVPSLLNQVVKDVPEFRPVNIMKQHINKSLLDYSITNKLDGIGYNFTILQDKIGKDDYLFFYLFNAKDLWRPFMIKVGNLTETISQFISIYYKCEVKVTETNIEIHFFDCVNSPTSKIHTQPLSDRLAYCDKLVQALQTLKNEHPTNPQIQVVSFETKQFFQSEDLFNNITDCIKYMNVRYGMKKLLDNNDGIIFQSKGDYSTKTVNCTLKWKFPSKVTIDFTLKYKSKTDTEVTYSLNVRTTSGQKVFIDEINKEEHQITVNKSDQFDGFYGHELHDKVAECDYSQNEFHIHRIRFDKGPEGSNFISVANDTFRDMIYELTLPSLIKQIKALSQPLVSATLILEEEKKENVIVSSKKTFKNNDGEYVSFIENGVLQRPMRFISAGYQQPKEKPLHNYRRYHNQIKDHLIQQYAGEIVLDLGSGAGGDISKYAKVNHIKKLFLVEPSSTNIEELKRRLEMSEYASLKPKVRVLQAGAEETARIVSFVKEELGEKGKVDTIFMFFVLTFFFKNREILVRLFQTISSLLKTNGDFITTVMEGTFIKPILQEKGDIIKKDYYIKKIEINDTEENLEQNCNQNFYNNQVEFHIEGTVTATKQIEYLFLFQEFNHIASYFNLGKIKSLKFNQFQITDDRYLKQLDEDERFLNEFYSMYIFRKDVYVKDTKSYNIPVNITGDFNDYYYRTTSNSRGSLSIFEAIIFALTNESNLEIEQLEFIRERIREDFLKNHSKLFLLSTVANQISLRDDQKIELNNKWDVVDIETVETQVINNFSNHISFEIETISLPQSLKLEDPSFISKLEMMYTENWNYVKNHILREEFEIYNILKEQGWSIPKLIMKMLEIYFNKEIKIEEVTNHIQSIDKPVIKLFPFFEKDALIAEYQLIQKVVDCNKGFITMEGASDLTKESLYESIEKIKIFIQESKRDKVTEGKIKKYIYLEYEPRFYPRSSNLFIVDVGQKFGSVIYSIYYIFMKNELGMQVDSINTFYYDFVATLVEQFTFDYFRDEMSHKTTILKLQDYLMDNKEATEETRDAFIKAKFKCNPVMKGTECLDIIKKSIVKTGFPKKKLDDFVDLALFESYVEAAKELEVSNYLQIQMLHLISDLLNVNIYLIDDRKEENELMYQSKGEYELNVILYSKDYFMTVQPLVKNAASNQAEVTFTKEEVDYLLIRHKYKTLYADERTQEREFKIEVENYENGVPIILIDSYSTEEQISDPKILSRYFPMWVKSQSKGYRQSNVKVDIAKMQMSNRSLYSTATREDGQFTSQKIKEMLELLLPGNKNFTMLDGCSNVGGNAIWFAQDFSKVTSVEIDKNDYLRLTHNLSQYGFGQEQIETINDSVLNVINRDRRWNAIFFDPPWGGPLYKYIDQLVLALDYKDTVEIIDDLLEKDKADIIILKHPNNVYINSRYECFSTMFYKNYEVRGHQKRVFYYGLTFWINPKYIVKKPISSEYRYKYSHKEIPKEEITKPGKSLFEKAMDLVKEEEDFPRGEKDSRRG